MKVVVGFVDLNGGTAREDKDGLLVPAGAEFGESFAGRSIGDLMVRGIYLPEGFYRVTFERLLVEEEKDLLQEIYRGDDEE